MGWIAFLRALLAVFGKLVEVADKRRAAAVRAGQVDVGRRQALADLTEEAVGLLVKAEDARRAFDARLRRDPDSLHDDDGFKRARDPPGSDGLERQ